MQSRYNIFSFQRINDNPFSAKENPEFKASRFIDWLMFTPEYVLFYTFQRVNYEPLIDKRGRLFGYVLSLSY